MRIVKQLKNKLRGADGAIDSRTAIAHNIHKHIGNWLVDARHTLTEQNYAELSMWRKDSAQREGSSSNWRNMKNYRGDYVSEAEQRRRRRGNCCEFAVHKILHLFARSTDHKHACASVYVCM